MQCFVIGPLGDEGSETRGNADHLYDFVIEPVLQSFGFEVVRADRLKAVSSITDDIVNLIQSSELCVIDLSEANANVFYEAGRRHETGRPFIHFLQAGQKAPFDVQGIRYISYRDLTSAANVFDAQKRLRDFVQLIMKTGFGAVRSSNPLNNLEEGLRRIEAKLSILALRFEGNAHSLVSRSQPSSGVMTNSSHLVDPQKRLSDSLKNKDLRGAEEALVELDEISYNKDEILNAAAMLARVGRPKAAAVIQRHISSNVVLPNLKGGVIASALVALYNFYRVTGQAEHQRGEFVGIVNNVIQSERFIEYSESEKATIANAAQLICFLTRDYESALQYANMSVQLAPKDPILRNNLAMIFEKMGDNVRAANEFATYASLICEQGMKLKPEHLEFGARLYTTLGQLSKAQEMISLLAEVSPQGAADLQRKLHGRLS